MLVFRFVPCAVAVRATGAIRHTFPGAVAKGAVVAFGFRLVSTALTMTALFYNKALVTTIPHTHTFATARCAFLLLCGVDWASEWIVFHTNNTAFPIFQNFNPIPSVIQELIS